jgi:hypothetical protein
MHVNGHFGTVFAMKHGAEIFPAFGIPEPSHKKIFVISLWGIMGKYNI